MSFGHRLVRGGVVGILLLFLSKLGRIKSHTELKTITN